MFAIIWTSWLFQSLFSPSHIILDVCGVMTGGALIGLADKVNRETKAYVK